MKPPGLYMGLSGGALHVGVTRSSQAEDAIWSAVEKAIDEDMTVDQFRRECRQAWSHALDERAKWADKDWSKS